MVSRAKKNSEDMPFITLDMERFSNNASYTQDEVRKYLQDRIPDVEERESDSDDTRTAKGDLIKSKRDAFAKQNAEAELALFEKDPETYTALFALKKNTEEDTYNRSPESEDSRDSERSKAKIYEDENGNLFLAVEIMKPTDVSFQISDGKLSFDPKGLSPDKLKEIIDYLDRRGLLPYARLDGINLENADEQTQDMFNQVKDEIKEDLQHDGNVITTEGNDNSLLVNENTSQENSPNSSNQENENDDEEGGSGEDSNEVNDNEEDRDNGESLPFSSSDKSKKNTNGDAYDNAMQHINKWMNKNKRRHLSYFVTHEKGYTVFTTFDRENAENMKLDNVIDSKTKDAKVRHECKIYIRQNPNGKVEISFSNPGSKPITDAYADLIMDAHKEAGNTRIKFGKMPDADESVIRAACGRALRVPVGLKLSQTKYDKMIEAAEGKNGKNNPKVIKYRRDLAMEMASQLEQKGIIWDKEENRNNAECRCIRAAIGAYDYAPFRDLWEDFGLRTRFEEIVKSNGSNNPNGAAAAIGAAKAVSKLYAIYGEGIDSSKNPDGNLEYFVSDRCHSLNAEEKKQFRSIIAGKEKMQVRDIPPETAKKLFEIMLKTQEKETAMKIEDEYKRLIKDDFYRGNATRDAVMPYLHEANEEMATIGQQIREDYGLPQIGIMKIGAPKYDFSRLQEELRGTASKPRQQQTSSTNLPTGTYRGSMGGGRSSD